MSITKKPISAIKFRNFCFNNNLESKDIAEKLGVKYTTIYKYWSGRTPVPDESKKILEKEFGLDIYEVFFNEEL